MCQSDGPVASCNKLTSSDWIISEIKHLCPYYAQKKMTSSMQGGLNTGLIPIAMTHDEVPQMSCHCNTNIPHNYILFTIS